MHKIMAASAVAPGVSYSSAMEKIHGGAVDPVLGKISIEHVQLCPQHAGRISEGLLDTLMEKYPGTKFRIHATPRVDGNHIHQIAEAIDAFDHKEQMDVTANLSKRAKAVGYTLHAGRREKGTLKQAFDNTRRLADLFGCRVGIEGLYPTNGGRNTWLLANWQEYEEMLEDGVDFAIDLSHLNIVAKRERCRKDDLVRDMLRSPSCIEVHVSDNDKRSDSHQPLDAVNHPWWLPMLSDVNPEAIVFYEGIIFNPRKQRHDR